jgi:Aminoglycoside-2''-adenylyltransferase
MPFDPAIESIAALLTPLPIIWGFCGGWAIDLFLNRITRVHKDVDVAILRTDQRLVFDFLRRRDWTLNQVVDGKLLPFQEDEVLTLPIHTIWCRNKGYHPDFLEILLNESERDKFLFRRNRSIRSQLNKVFLSSASGFPVLAPEVVLLYKSNQPLDTGNWLDFQSALPLLNTQRIQWLIQALYKISPEHEWLKYLLEQ